MNERRPIGLTVPYREVGYKEKKEWEIKPKWVGLTELERAEITKLKWWDWEDSFDVEGFARAIEAKLKEKNGM